MRQTTFDIPKMDCPSEERIIRMAIEHRPGVYGLDFDLARRRLTVRHEGDPGAVLDLLTPLNFGARISESGEAGPWAAQSTSQDESRVLWILLTINGVMFFVEIVAGLLAQSAGLIADSLDMFADAAVYGISLYAVGKAASVKSLAARVSGIAQALLAAGVLVEVVRRFIGGSEPIPSYMMGISFLALTANVACMALISKHREGGVHMRASWIFSTNDVIANLGVIVAGALVAWTGSHVPDLLIGTVIALVVFWGAVRILRLAKMPEPD